MKALQIHNLGQTNLIFTIIAILGYIGIWWGAIPHLSLGLFQVVLCLFLILKRYKYIQPLKEHLTIYGSLVITDLAFFYLFDSDYAFYAWAATFALAFYFTYIMYQIKKLNYENHQ